MCADVSLLQTYSLAGRPEKSRSKKTRPFGQHLLSVLVIILCCFLFAVPRVQAAPLQFSRDYRPPYLDGLERYLEKLEQHNREMERLKREKILEQSTAQHIVKRGETLSGIARHYEVDTGELAYWNEIENPHLILPGQALDILLIDGTMHQVQEGDTAQAIARSYGVDSEEIIAFNLLDGRNPLPEGEALVIPGGRIPGEEKAAIRAVLFGSQSLNRQVASRAYGELRSAPSFQWPLDGTITSRYGWRNGSFHYGLDIAASHGSLVRAAAQGTVEEMGYRGSYGLVVTIDHGNGWSTLYAHNSRVLVQSGEQVASGQPVARVGVSGRATGPHVHFEVMYYGNRKDPLHYLERR